MKHVLLLLLILSCTRLREREEQTREWIGRNIQELKRHPVFSGFRVRQVKRKDGTEVLTLADGGPMVTDARCQGLGGCDGFSELWCEHIFTTKEDTIIHYEQLGPCPYNPELAPIEERNK